MLAANRGWLQAKLLQLGQEIDGVGVNDVRLGVCWHDRSLAWGDSNDDHFLKPAESAFQPTDPHKTGFV
jgi:hypothetical protein